MISWCCYTSGRRLTHSTLHANFCRCQAGAIRASFTTLAPTRSTTGISVARHLSLGQGFTPLRRLPRVIPNFINIYTLGLRPPPHLLKMSKRDPRKGNAEEISPALKWSPVVQLTSHQCPNSKCMCFLTVENFEIH